SFIDVTSPETIDRVTPTLEPDAQMVMRQDWHHLLFLHWEVPPSELQALLPPGLDLDTFDGKAYVGLVPFTLTGVRPILTQPLPDRSNFFSSSDTSSTPSTSVIISIALACIISRIRFSARKLIMSKRRSSGPQASRNLRSRSFATTRAK